MTATLATANEPIVITGQGEGVDDVLAGELPCGKLPQGRPEPMDANLRAVRRRDGARADDADAVAILRLTGGRDVDVVEAARACRDPSRGVPFARQPRADHDAPKGLAHGVEGVQGVLGLDRLGGAPALGHDGDLPQGAGDDGAESCADCSKYKDKRHKASWWISHNAVPPNRDFECGGYNCEHYLIDDDGITRI